MWWELAIVLVIQAAAIGYLVYRFWPRGKRPRILTKPDVKASSLVRKKRVS